MQIRSGVVEGSAQRYRFTCGGLRETSVEPQAAGMALGWDLRTQLTTTRFGDTSHGEDSRPRRRVPCRGDQFQLPWSLVRGSRDTAANAVDPPSCATCWDTAPLLLEPQ